MKKWKFLYLSNLIIVIRMILKISYCNCRWKNIGFRSFLYKNLCIFIETMRGKMNGKKPFCKY